MKKTILAVFSALLLCIWLLAMAIWTLGTWPEVMCGLMERYAPPDATSLPAAEYLPVAEMITDYLAGDREVFQHTFTAGGTVYFAFNQKEQAHMADVQGLFRLINGQVLMLALALTIGLIVESQLFLSERMLRAFRRTLLGVLAAVTALIFAAAIDFGSLFVLFHQVAFTNDLWLLDPRTDLLIRLMPIEFFVSYAAIIGCCWLLGMAILLIVSTILINKRKPTEGE